MPSALLQRDGKVGVIWPNNRDVAELVPYLDRLAAGRAGVPDLPATAAPTARRACCASATAIDGELRATGQVLRDQFVFMLRAGFDAFEVKKDGRRGSLRARPRKRYSVFYQPTGDGRVTAFNRRLQLRHVGEAPGRCTVARRRLRSPVSCGAAFAEAARARPCACAMRRRRKSSRRR